MTRRRILLFISYLSYHKILLSFIKLFYVEITQQTFQRCFNVGIYNVRQCWINVVCFNVDMNNVRPRRNNVVIFNVEIMNAFQELNLNRFTL